MTQSKGAPKTLATAFDFSRHMRNPEFRSMIKSRGWLPEHDVVVTTDNEHANSLLARFMVNQTSSPCLVVWPSPVEPETLLFMFAVSGPVPKQFLRRKRVSSMEISPTTSVGMIYDSMIDCGDFVPQEWGTTIRFAAAAPAE